MSIRSSLLLAAALAAVALVQARPDAQAPASDIPAIPFETYTLPNGLTVILSEDHRLPMVAVNLWYHVGPANEEPGRTGFAHLFEHMMFQSSKHVPPDSFFKFLEGAGASDINGTTDFDRTNYFETLPSNQLELALWLESDRMGYLLDTVDQASLSNQQDVVRNERRQSVENRPYGPSEEALFHAIFPKTHPYYASVIGSHEDIQAVKLDDVQRFFKTYYAPNNASLAVVGDIDKAATKALIEQYFGTLKRGPEVPTINVATPPITSERRLVVQDRVELPRVYASWITSPIFKPGDADADIAGVILGDGRSSRLYRSLVYDKQIAQSVSAQQQSLILGSVFQIEATARPGHTAAEVEAALFAELDRLQREGPTDAEVERARNTIETRIIRALETLGGFGGVADRLNSYNHYLGTPDYLARDIARYRGVTPASVKAFVADQLKPSARVVLHAIPGEPQLAPEVPKSDAAASAGTGAQSMNTDEPWRMAVPKAAEARPLLLPIPQRLLLSNGLSVFLVERPGLPIVAANLVVRTGSDANPVDKPGLANFAVAMLTEGTMTRSALQIAEETAQLGAALATASTMDSSLVTLRSLEKNFPAAVRLMADVVLHPSFPEAEVERQRASRLAGLVQRREEPNTVATSVMNLALYGPNHPYAFAEIGTEASVRSLRRDDMQAFWRARFVPSNAALVVAGSIGMTALKPLLEEAFGGWARGETPVTALPAPVSTSARLVIVDKPGSPQTQLRVATIGVPRSTPEYEALEVLNATLGGLFASRINMNLREEHGYTYGAASRFLYRREPGPFLIASGVRTDVTAPAVSEIFKEVARITTDPMSGEELALSRDSIARSLPGFFETSASAAGSIADLYTYGLELDFYTKLPARIAQVSAGGVLTAAKKYLPGGKMIVVAVGDRSKIEPELAKLNLGPIEIRDADGKVVAATNESPAPVR